MKEISLVFPHQLYQQHPALAKNRKVVLLEDELYFLQYHFHQQKLVLHRASMRYYEDKLQKEGFKTEYIECVSPDVLLKNLFDKFSKDQIAVIHYADTTDYLLERRLKRYAERYQVKLKQYSSPNFICQLDYLHQYFNKKKKYFLTDFYIEQRKRLQIMTSQDQPQGGKWTFDTENRKKMPAGTFIPSLPVFPQNKYVQEAIAYVNQHFHGNYGSLENFIYPVTAEDAEKGLEKFLQERFAQYGIYQDAIVKNQSFLFHSLLTPALNIGLLDPLQIINKAISFANDHEIPINSLEGFVRQILGWREYIRVVYQREGVKERTRNFWQFSRKIPASFWKGTTGIEPVDDAIRKLQKTGYNHHIERLMILGNFMCLCEFDPDEVYRWFMEMYIDSYDWVMVPNVYGMSQFADGGLMATKPYISGSNYVLKMSDFKKGNWCETWDALFWRFLHVRRDFFMKNPRLSMLIRTFDKMPAEKRNKHLSVAENFLAKLDK